MKVEELSKDINETLIQKEKLEVANLRLKEDVDALRRSDKESQAKAHNYYNALQDIKVTVHTCHVIARDFAAKVINLSKEEPSKNFTDNLLHFASEFQYKSDESIGNVEDWLRLLTVEIEIWHDKMKYNIEQFRESSTKMKSLEQTIKTFSINEDELLGKERKLTQIYQEVSENFNRLEQDNTQLQREYGKVVRDAKQMKMEIQNLAEENTSLKMDCSKIVEENESILREQHEKTDYLNKVNYQIEALEERIVILSKEKKYLESLITK